MTGSESPAALLGRAADQMRTDARTFQPGSQDERFRLAVASWLFMEVTMLPYAAGDTASALRIADAYLGEA